MYARITDWTHPKHISRLEWSPEWPMLEPQHLRPAAPDEAGWMRMTGNLDTLGGDDPHCVPIYAWACRVHALRAPAILIALATMMGRHLDVAPILAGSAAPHARRALWDALCEDPYRRVTCHEWNKLAVMFGYDRVDKDIAVDGWSASLNARFGGEGFDGDVLWKVAR